MCLYTDMQENENVKTMNMHCLEAAMSFRKGYGVLQKSVSPVFI